MIFWRANVGGTGLLSRLSLDFLFDGDGDDEGLTSDGFYYWLGSGSQTWTWNKWHYYTNKTTDEVCPDPLVWTLEM